MAWLVLHACAQPCHPAETAMDTYLALIGLNSIKYLFMAVTPRVICVGTDNTAELVVQSGF